MSPLTGLYRVQHDWGIPLDLRPSAKSAGNPSVEGAAVASTIKGECAAMARVSGFEIQCRLVKHERPESTHDYPLLPQITPKTQIDRTTLKSNYLTVL